MRREKARRKCGRSRDRLCFATHSSQAPTPLSDDGVLVNIDGLGNRLAAICYGPKQVIVVAGINKVAHSEEAAIARARNVAAPTNIHRFPEKVTPCRKTGKCGDCVGEDCICRQILITRMSMIPDRIKVVLINDDLGF